MKRTLQLSVLLAAPAFCLLAAEPSSSGKDAVMKAEKEWTAAVLKGDRSTLEKLLSPDLSYTHSSAKTQTKEEFIKDVTGGSTKYTSIDFDDTKLRQYGTTVVVTHAATIVSVQTGSSHLYITEVWAQEGGRWQMVSRQATKIP
jgi:hypothetical protein